MEQAKFLKKMIRVLLKKKMTYRCLVQDIGINQKKTLEFYGSRLVKQISKETNTFVDIIQRNIKDHHFNQIKLTIRQRK